MPTLDWIGKKKVVNHHLDVPFRVLEKKYTYSAENKAQTSENKIIHGDNLEALKSLLPEYEGKIDCIYIDPPYNTGNDNGKEGWIYSDNVSDPKIKKWLGEVVGKENEDLTRHDKWLCMMYPRIKLLHKLLNENGILIVSIDDIEYCNLRYLLEEIFSPNNYIATIVWKKRYQGAKEKRIVVLQEYALVFAKDINNIDSLFIPATKELIERNYKYKDEFFELRGPYRTQPLEAGNSMGDRENLRTPITAPDGSLIYPRRQWIWSEKRIKEALDNHEIGFSNKDGNWSVFIKQYLIDRDGTQRMTKPFSIIDDVYTQNGTREMEEIFNDGNIFPFPKPSKYITELLTMAYRKKDAIILDSFAGSGTTAHAVLNMNKADGGNRKFILIEMMDYAESITAERVKRVIKGYADKEGTGGEFSFYELGEPFLINNLLNERVDTQTIREYIWFTETKSKFLESKEENKYFLGNKFGASYFFYYEKEKATTLDFDFLATIKQRYEQYIIYADICLLPVDFMQRNNIIFKKIPRDIKKF